MKETTAWTIILSVALICLFSAMSFETYLDSKAKIALKEYEVQLKELEVQKIEILKGVRND